MSFRGKFNWFQSIRQGGRKAISFTLTCSNMFQTETFDAVIIDGTGQNNPMFFHQERLAAGKSFRFDIDSVGWDWCQGDIFAILNKKGEIDKSNQWKLNIKVPAPGECKECHGTHKCKYCNGTGIITNYSTHDVTACTNCYGTGVCQGCYVPIRMTNTVGVGQQTAGMGSIYNTTNMPTPSIAKQRKIETLRQRIQELQMKIERADWDEKIMKLRGTDITFRNNYMSQVSLKYQYEKQLTNLQYELQQLENTL